MTQTLTKQCVSEFIGTFTLIFIGVGAIFNASHPDSGMGLLGVALAHGLTIAVMVTAVGGICGGQLNPAVTFGLLVGGHNNLRQSVAYWIAQLLGGSAAAFLLLIVFASLPIGAVQIVAKGRPALARTVC